MASSFAIGYMLAVPVLATLTDRMDARIVLLTGSAVSAIATFAFGLFANDLLSAILHLGTGRHRLRRCLHAGPQGADRSAGSGRHLAQRDAVHGNILLRRRSFVPDCAACGRYLGLARGILSDRARPAGDDRSRPGHGSRAGEVLVQAAVRLQACFSQPAGARLRARLRRALLRAVRAAHLDRRLLDLHCSAQWRLGGARADRRQCHRRGAGDAGQHHRQRGGHPLSAGSA